MGGASGVLAALKPGRGAFGLKLERFSFALRTPRLPHPPPAHKWWFLGGAWRNHASHGEFQRRAAGRRDQDVRSVMPTASGGPAAKTTTCEPTPREGVLPVPSPRR